MKKNLAVTAKTEKSNVHLDLKILHVSLPHKKDRTSNQKQKKKELYI
jgi:hypothetical protein